MQGNNNFCSTSCIHVNMYMSEEWPPIYTQPTPTPTQASVKGEQKKFIKKIHNFFKIMFHLKKYLYLAQLRVNLPHILVKF